MVHRDQSMRWTTDQVKAMMTDYQATGMRLANSSNWEAMRHSVVAKNLTTKGVRI